MSTDDLIRRHVWEWWHRHFVDLWHEGTEAKHRARRLAEEVARKRAELRRRQEVEQ